MFAKLIGKFFAIFALVARANGEKTVMVSTPVGSIKGLQEEFVFDGQPYNVSVFMGIPYAESTEGSRRFAKPVKKAPFDDVFDATELTPACLQNSKWAFGFDKTTSEDCLTLNIIAPSDSSSSNPKAVMIYIYGGGFQFGNQDPYLSSSLSALYDVIYVTLNYRLSAYGFLASRKNGLKGNYGLWDQHMAIQWIHDNIFAFGGDSNRVTIFGESAGAASVIYQALYEGNKGLFQRVIAQSGVAGNFWSYNPNPDILYNTLAENAGCQSAGCLRNLKDSDMQDALTFGDMYLPVQDGDFIKYDPATFLKKSTVESTKAIGHFTEKDVIIGMNSDEGYSESMLFMFIYSENLEQLFDGITKEEMRKFTKQLLSYYNQSTDTRVLNVIRHQYTDWSDPGSDNARRAQYYDIVRDFQYTLTTKQGLDLHSGAANAGRTYMYHFEHKPSYSQSPDFIHGADHGDEVVFALGFPFISMLRYGFNDSDTAAKIPPNEVTLSKNMMKYWTQFAKYGNPNGNENNVAEDWLQYDPVNQRYIRFMTDVDKYPTATNYRNEYVNFWDEIYPIVVNFAKRDGTGECVINSAETYTVSFLTYFYSCFSFIFFLYNLY